MGKNPETSFRVIIVNQYRTKLLILIQFIYNIYIYNTYIIYTFIIYPQIVVINIILLLDYLLND